MWKPRGNGQISRKIEPSKTQWGRSKKLEQTNNEIEADENEEVIKKKPPNTQKPWTRGIHRKIYKAFKEELTPTFTDYSKKFKNMEDSQTLFKS